MNLIKTHCIYPAFYVNPANFSNYYENYQNFQKD